MPIDVPPPAAVAAALGDDAVLTGYTPFGDEDASWYAAFWRTPDEPVRFAVYGHAPEPFTKVLDEGTPETDAMLATSAALGKVVLACAAADPAIAAMHWRRERADGATTDEVAVAATAQTASGEVVWYAAAHLGGRYEQYRCDTDDPEPARRAAAEMVLRHGLIDSRDPSSHDDADDLAAVLSIEAWAAHVLAEETRRRAEGVHGFAAGAEELTAILA